MGYRKKENEEEFIKQSGEIKQNTVEIIEKIKSKCNESNLKGEVEGNKSMLKHYELESGLHVYIGDNRTIISEKELRSEELAMYHVDSNYIRLERNQRNNSYTKDDFITLAGRKNLGSIDEDRKGIMTTAEHVNYLEPEDKNIFDLAENQTKRLNDEDRQESESALEAFKEKVEKEIGEIEKQVENKEIENGEMEKIDAEIVEPENINRKEIEDERKNRIEAILKGIEELDLSENEINELSEYLKLLKTRQAEENQNNQGKKQEEEQQGG